VRTSWTWTSCGGTLDVFGNDSLVQEWVLIVRSVGKLDCDLKPRLDVVQAEMRAVGGIVLRSRDDTGT
jgi:hypothetical protein